MHARQSGRVLNDGLVTRAGGPGWDNRGAQHKKLGVDVEPMWGRVFESDVLRGFLVLRTRPVLGRATHEVSGDGINALDGLKLTDKALAVFRSDNGGLHVPELREDASTYNTLFRTGKGYGAASR